MKLLDEIRGMRVYLDANIFIYAFEAYEPYRTLLEILFSRFEQGMLHPVTSALTLAEVLVKPCEQGAHELVQTYYKRLASANTLELAPITLSVLMESARIRATTRTVLHDAIHVATARMHQCETFVSNGRHLKRTCPDMFLLLDDCIEE